MKSESIAKKLNSKNYVVKTLGDNGKMIIACVEDIFDGHYLGMWSKEYWRTRVMSDADFYLDTFERLLKNTDYSQQTAKEIFNALDKRFHEGRTIGGVLAGQSNTRYRELRKAARSALNPAKKVFSLAA